MLASIKKALGLEQKTQRVKVKLPEGLDNLEVVSAKGWWK